MESKQRLGVEMTKLPKNTQIKNNVPGEPLWLSGKVME
jgi:hypothetical protein